ncbi:hypothetical protein Tco_1361931 [Tanacetum coccineum]
MSLLTPSDIQHFRCYPDLGVLQIVVISYASSTVTYASVYTNSEPGRVFWGADEEISEGGSPRVIVLGYDGLPIQLVAPPSLDYIPCPEEPQTSPVPQDEDEREAVFIQPHDPDYVSEPIYPEYIPLEDKHVFPIKDQLLPPIDSPTAESLGYVAESDPEEDPEEYKDDETEDGPVDYPMDGGDDGDDDDGDSSEDDADDEDEDDEDEEEEEEEHLAPADSAVVASISLPPEAEVERLLAMPTPSPSPPISLSPPSTLRIASTQALIDAVTATLPSPPLLPLPPSLYIPPPIDCRDDVPESELIPRKRLCLSTLGSRYEIRESITARPIRELAEFHKRDTRDLYALLEDAQDGRTRISQRVSMDSQRVDLLMRDRMTLQETVWIVEEEAYASREAWAHSIGLSLAVHHELQTHRDHVYAHETHIQAIRHIYSCRVLSFRYNTRWKTLRVMRDMRREMSDMQAELLAHQEQQRRARQPGPDARIPDHQDASRDVDNLLRKSTNGDVIPSSHGDNRRNVQTARPYFYADFMKCQPLNFKGTEGVVGLTRRIEKMESVFNISGCAIENQGEIKKLEIELWNLKVKGNDVPTYTERFQELTLICTKFIANETEKIDKYISGLPDNIYGSVKSSRPKTLDETIELANDFMD